MDILSIGLLLLAAVLAYLLYRQQHLFSAAQHTLNERDRSLQTARQELASRDARLEEKTTALERLDQDLRTLREKITTGEHAAVPEPVQPDTERVIVELREQIEATKHASSESQALFQTISSIAFDVVLVLNEDHIIVAVNRAADALFGQKHPVGEKLSDVIQSPDLNDIVKRAMSEKDGLEEQIMLDNAYFRVRTGVMCYANNHAFIGVALQDVTSLVKLNRARRDMVANISHELRTPIQNIRLTIDGLFYDQNRPKRKASIASLRSIARETNALLWLVQELYDLSMIESGQAIMKLVPVRLLDIVNDSVARLKDQLQQKHLKAAVHVPEKLIALCDFEQTRRVVMNLLHNAIKWSPENDAITVSAGGNGDEITVRVFDNGPGVPDDQRERIFERFYQVDSSRSKREGTGLGLAICKHIIEAHGGQIWAEGNTAGSGGRFVFTLLDGGTEAAVAIPAVAAGQHDAGLNMLIAARYTGSDAPDSDEGEIELED